MFVRSIDINFLSELKVWLKTTSRTDVLEAVQNFSSVVSRLLL
jgi:hypothetical protein